MEMVYYCWGNGYQGILSDDAELALFMPPRLFSAHSLKLTTRVNILKSNL